MLTDRIGGLDDFAAVNAVETFAGFFEGLPVSAGAAELAASYVDAAERDPSAPLEVDDPGALARDLLQAFAAQGEYVEAVGAAVAEASDTQLAARPILAVGVAASLIIVAATTEVDVDAGPVHVHKTAASPELLTRVGDVLRPYAPGAKRTTVPDRRGAR